MQQIGSTHSGRFRALHAAPKGFIMPNAWDAGSAILLAQSGFDAIATTSAGIAFSLGYGDYDVRNSAGSVDKGRMFARIREITAAVQLPVNGDLEEGYGDTPDAVATTIREAIAAGLAGGNIEDKRRTAEGLYAVEEAVDRIRAAKEAAAALDPGFVLTARTDVFLARHPGGVAEAIRRANRYREAGADCLYAPGPVDLETAQQLVRGISAPVNVVIGLGSAAGNAHALIAAGVQRVSLGGSIMRATLGLVRHAATELQASGSTEFARQQIPQPELTQLFSAARAR